MQKLDKLVSDNSERVNKTLTYRQEITDKINSGQGTLGLLVNDSKLHDQLLATVTEIKAAATDAKAFANNAEAIMDQIKAGQGTLGTLIYDQKAADDIRTSLANIRAVSDKLASGQGTLGKLISDDSLYNSRADDHQEGRPHAGRPERLRPDHGRRHRGQRALLAWPPKPRTTRRPS